LKIEKTDTKNFGTRLKSASASLVIAIGVPARSASPNNKMRVDKLLLLLFLNIPVRGILSFENVKRYA
jgi:hypothetical protein